ncbi:hypothetical protein BH23CHL4_BH23CHL4_02370 [soil metagenome]
MTMIIATDHLFGEICYDGENRRQRTLLIYQFGGAPQICRTFTLNGIAALCYGESGVQRHHLRYSSRTRGGRKSAARKSESPAVDELALIEQEIGLGAGVGDAASVGYCSQQES